MSGQGTVPTAILREGQVGPELTGTAGQFLAFDTDGRHVKGVDAPTSGSVAAAGTDVLGDVGPVGPNATTPSADGGDHTALALTGQATFAAGTKLLVTGFAVCVGDGSAGLVRSGFNAEYSFDGGATWAPAPGAASSVFTAVDDTNPASTISMAATPIDLSGQARFRLRLSCFSGVGAAVASVFQFVRASWILSAV